MNGSPDENASESVSNMSKLIVVESPSKAKTIGKYLGKEFVVKASVGHVKDLPKKSLGVDVQNDFAPVYEVIRGKKKVLTDIRKSARTAEAVYLAPDPDREGEAIAWHIAEELKSVNPNIYRVLFNEITKKGIHAGLSNPAQVDQKRFESQQTRRILDRLVGYQISPLLWKKVKQGLSAGRVQSVAVRLVLEREREIRAFVPVEYWSIIASLITPQGAQFDAKVVKISGRKAGIKNEAEANDVVTEIKTHDPIVAGITRKEQLRRPLPPFITSKLQQDAIRKFHYTAKRTMALAQRLYEGVDLGDGQGPVGLITYMRTDSTRVAEEALTDARQYIANRFGNDYMPDKPNYYRSRKGAQDAHEAIRPTSVGRDPDRIYRALVARTQERAQRSPGAQTTKLKAQLRENRELHRLYSLIWKRFVASQMVPARLDKTVVDVATGKVGLQAQGLVMKFPGYTAVYEEARDDGEAANGNDKANGASNGDAKATGDAAPGDGKGGKKSTILPPIHENDRLQLDKVVPEQKFTQPPPRFSEATLVKELEEKGIGRPSTYAAILSTIQDRGYAVKDKGRFHVTPLGELVTDLLVESFPDILNVEFTAQMEDRLDRIEEGLDDWRKTLADFYGSFKKDLDQAKEGMRNVKKETTPTDLECEKCGAKMVIRWGRNGEFLACSRWPDCKNSKEFRRLDDGTIEVVHPEVSKETCDLCGAPMVVRNGRYGKFLSCSRYPDCRFTKPLTLGIACPKKDCDGQIVQKRSKRGKTFYGCSKYASTGCDFVVWDRPVDHQCPHCGYPIMTVKAGRQGDALVCPECKGRDRMPDKGAANKSSASQDKGAANNAPTFQDKSNESGDETQAL